MAQTQPLTDSKYNSHRTVATQVRRLYIEVDKLATKKPAEQLTRLISMKVNHVIARTKELVPQDEFLDAIESVPTEGQFIRLDEALIILSELIGILDRQWESDAFLQYRKRYGLKDRQTIKSVL